MDETVKICEYCEIKFYRLPKHVRRDWERRKYCSIHCSTQGTAYVRTTKSSQTRRGKPSPFRGRTLSPVSRLKISLAKTGRKLSPEHKKKIGDAQRGEKSSSWKGGVTTEAMCIRRSAEYRAWAKAVKERDNYTCQHCHVRGGYLHSDHIKSFAAHPELRFDVNNGRTLCVPCHTKTPTWGRKSWQPNAANL